MHFTFLTEYSNCRIGDKKPSQLQIFRKRKGAGNLRKKSEKNGLHICGLRIPPLLKKAVLGNPKPAIIDLSDFEKTNRFILKPWACITK